MDKRDKIIQKQKELIELSRKYANVNDAEILKLFTQLESELSLLEKETGEEEEEQPIKYEPYFGWCDVSGCKGEGCSGGNVWRDTGYWTVCSKHSASYRNGDPQPKMKQSAIKREKSRDKITGYLSLKNQ
jgi:restriction endonuclease S subunit